MPIFRRSQPAKLTPVERYDREQQILHDAWLLGRGAQVDESGTVAPGRFLNEYLYLTRQLGWNEAVDASPPRPQPWDDWMDRGLEHSFQPNSTSLQQLRLLGAAGVRNLRDTLTVGSDYLRGLPGIDDEMVGMIGSLVVSNQPGVDESSSASFALQRRPTPVDVAAFSSRLIQVTHAATGLVVPSLINPKASRRHNLADVLGMGLHERTDLYMPGFGSNYLDEEPGRKDALLNSPEVYALQFRQAVDLGAGAGPQPGVA